MTSETPAQESAMTEIALALAMGFFSIMVLTIISMGSGAAPGVQKFPNISLVEPVDRQDKSSGLEDFQNSKKQKIIIFDGKRFMDTELRPLDVAKINSDPKNNDVVLVLAMPPEISIKSAMDAKNRIKAENLVVSHLNQAWLDALGSRNE